MIRRHLGSIAAATKPGSPDRENEDWTGFGGNVMVVVDGAGAPPQLGTGCRHGVSWYARQLGAAAIARSQVASTPLVDALGEAIADTALLHAYECELGHPGTPSAAIALARLCDDGLEYAILADCNVLVQQAGQLHQFTDTREATVGADLKTSTMWTDIGSGQHQQEIADYMHQMRSRRNVPGGFWVAAANPTAAAEAVHGTVLLGDGPVAIAIMSDGASRPFDLFYNSTPQSYMHDAIENGPDAMLARIRNDEDSDPIGERWPRAKRHDDASLLSAVMATR